MDLARFRRRLASTITTIGLSRHAAVPALRRVAEHAPLSTVRRASALLLGSTLIGLGVSLLVRADLGLPPYDVMSSALRDLLGVSLGQAGWLVAGVLFLIAALLGRRPSLWGIGYIVANGIAIDAVSGVLTTPTSLVGRLGYLAAGIALIALAVSLVVYSGTTGGPFELLMLAGEDRGVNRLTVRYLLDFGVFGVGLVLGGNFGPGTIAFALLFGVVLQAFSQGFEDHRTGRRLRLERATTPR